MFELSKIKINPNNPRMIKDKSFDKLKNNIEKNIKLLKYRPIVYDDKNDNIIIAGNMRYRALLDLGFKEVPDEYTMAASDLSDKEKESLGIIDNVIAGEFNYDILATDYEITDLEEWGVDLDFLGDSVVPKDDQPVNFIITCKNEQEQESLQSKLGIQSNKIDYNKFCEVVGF